ncbi:IS3 family transposase [Niallia taxi]|uniref:IS3 family transposase n=1 Tax=Niallia taxi TaxID=2499688 RepID=UPI002550DA21|nr:IS3 family transposase [Niallia taxi]MDK8643656.1 IS3 family transposase [Niallia taxi]
MAKFSIEEKISAVLEYIDGDDGVNTIARKIGVNYALFQDWIKQYKLHGEKAFEKRYTNYSVDFKLDVSKFMNETGTSNKETAAIFNIPSPPTILKWRKAFEEGGIDALKPKKKGRPFMSEKSQKKTKKTPDKGSVEELQEEIYRLKMENAYFKKVECLSSGKGKATKQEKVKAIYELRKSFPIAELMKIAGIAKSTYYYQLKAIQRPDKYIEIKQHIEFIYHTNKGRYGYRRIHLELRNRGVYINHKTVQRLMKQLGLKSLVRIKKYRSYKGKVGQIAPNVLKRNFVATKPNEKWVTDVTEFHLFGQKLYLSPILDLYNGEIIAYNVEKRPVYSLVSKMLNQVLEDLPEGEKPILHSDQGWHYQMSNYRHVLKQHGITQSMSRKGNCLDNAVMENFFGLLKSELFYLHDFENMEHFKRELESYIYYYNHIRIKAKLKGMSPVQYRTHAPEAA